jgi:hypothetical protein
MKDISMTYNHEALSKTVLSQFYRDAIKIFINPKIFYESMSTEKDQQSIITFLFLTALLYSVAATLFARENQFIFLFLFFLNGFLMPFIMAAMLCLVLNLLQVGIVYRLALGITAYANTALLFAWIPGMAPFAEIYRYYLIGVGIVKVTGLNGWKAFFVLLGTAALLLLLIYFLQMLIAP